MSEDKNISLNINLSKIGQWIQSHVYWAAAIVTSFVTWRLVLVAWNMSTEEWNCSNSARAVIIILAILLFGAFAAITTANAIVESHDKSKRSY